VRETEFRGQGWFVRWSDLPGRLPARVFLHGMGGIAWAAFGHVAGHPALGGHRAIVIDLRGHGMSDRPSDWTYSLEDHADAIAGAGHMLMDDQPPAFAQALAAALPD
jgi:pimeloyl-ACP methyl ester carboxylesterase